MTLRILRDSALLELHQLAVSLFMVFCVFVQPFFISITALLILRHRPDFDPVFVIVGASLSGLWSVVLFDGTWIVGSERRLGTLELLAGAPTPIMVVIAGRLMGTVVFSTLSFVVNYLVGAWLFGYQIRAVDPWGFAISALLAAVSFWSTGLLISPLGILSRTMGQFLGILEYPVYALCGFLFPVLFLPGWAQPLSELLSPYWAALGLHVASSGPSSVPALARIWVIVVVEAAAQVALAGLLFGVVLRRARVTASLQLT